MVSSLWALLDDVVTLTKLAASKTIPILGDDLAVNAEKLSGGIKPERELPVIYTVFKWSMLNKVVVIAFALLLSAFLPSAIPYLLIAGALYLIFEGGVAVRDFVFARQSDGKEALFEHAIRDESVSMVDFEKDKIKGAVITDLVLSAEIIIIALGAIPGQSLMMQMLTLIAIGASMTIGVYGLVALIVKLDDIGLSLMKDNRQNSRAELKRRFGRSLLVLAVWIMEFLPIVGVAAMFMVGTDILVHQLDWLHHVYLSLENAILPLAGASIGAGLVWLFKFISGAILGYLLSLVETMFSSGKQNGQANI